MGAMTVFCFAASGNAHALSPGDLADNALANLRAQGLVTESRGADSQRQKSDGGE